jgi:hypothetical protein
MPQPMSNNDHRNLGFRLFDEIFCDLISQSKSIEIKYQVRFNNQSVDFSNNVIVTSVSGSKSPEEFRAHLTTLLESSLDNLFLSLQQTSSVSWSQQIGFIQYRLKSLSTIISEEQIFVPDLYGNSSLKKTFMSFSQCKLVAEDHHDFIMAGQWIRYQSQKFAEVWLQVIDEAVRRCGLIHDSLMKKLMTVSTSSEDEGSDSKYTGLKFNLSVSQLAYFIYLLVKLNVLDLPSRSITKLLNWVVRNFQSKGQESIRIKSFRNKFFTPDPSAIDSIQTLLKNMLAKIEEDHERLSK